MNSSFFVSVSWLTKSPTCFILLVYVFERADAFGTTFLSGLLRFYYIADSYGARAERHVLFVAATDFQCVVDCMFISDMSVCRVFGGTARSIRGQPFSEGCVKILLILNVFSL